MDDIQQQEEDPPRYRGKTRLPTRDSSASQPITRQSIPKSHTSIVPTKSFTYEEIVAATGNFRHAISRGASSKFYRAKLLNAEVTVKKFAERNESGFLSEVLAISRTDHPNIVKMLGYCIHESTKMLVMEFVPNNTLNFHLYGGRAPTIRWRNRMKIALGVAKGLAYLHEKCDPIIIHRNIKASNIFLDSDFEPKVKNKPWPIKIILIFVFIMRSGFQILGFGFAINTKSSVKSHTPTHSLGTGFMFPDYSLDNKHFDKYDVSSYGLILLGLVTGTKPSSYVGEAKRILPLLKEALRNKKYNGIADPALRRQFDVEEMDRVVRCAASCIYKSEITRPKMQQIVEALEGEISMRVIWNDSEDRRYLQASEVDIPLEQIWDEQ